MFVDKDIICGSVNDSADENLEDVLSEARRRARASAPTVWRALLDEINDGNVSAMRLYFDIFGRDIGMRPDDERDPSSEEIDSLRADIFSEQRGESDGLQLFTKAP
jgi:hypothetical protein